MIYVLAGLCAAQLAVICLVVHWAFDEAGRAQEAALRERRELLNRIQAPEAAVGDAFALADAEGEGPFPDLTHREDDEIEIGRLALDALAERGLVE